MKEFIVNASLYISIFGVLGRLFPDKPIHPHSSRRGRFWIGIALGLAGSLLMFFKIRMADAPPFEFSHLSVILAGITGGWLSAAVAAVMLTAARLAMLPIEANAWWLAGFAVLCGVGAIAASMLRLRRIGPPALCDLLNVVLAAVLAMALAAASEKGFLPSRPLMLWVIILLGSLFIYYPCEFLWRQRQLFQKLQSSQRRYRRMADQYQAVMESVREVIFRMDDEGRWTYLNPAWQEMTGFSVQDSLGRSWETFVQEEDHARLIDYFRREIDIALPPSARRYTQEGRFVRADGQVVWFEISARRLPDDRVPSNPEEPIGGSGLAGTMVNVTERKLAEQELQQANAALLQLARYDGLTGVGNRRLFDEVLVAEWRRAYRDDRLMSLIMLDIDHFKAYNDILGHQSGDACLSAVAEVMAEMVERQADLVARYGGEEFGVILPDTDEAGAIFVAERIRTCVENLAIPHPGSEVHSAVTVSIGLATLSPRKSTGPEELVARADRALYEAKQQGRNTVRVG